MCVFFLFGPRLITFKVPTLGYRCTKIVPRCMCLFLFDPSLITFKVPNLGRRCTKMFP